MKSLQYVRIVAYNNVMLLSTRTDNRLLGILIQGERFKNCSRFEIDNDTQNEIRMIENYYKNEKVCN